MKFAYSMLQDFVKTSLSAEEVGDLLTMAGFELEGLETVEGDPMLDIKVVSNRGDGLSVLGLAREVLAKAALVVERSDIPTSGTRSSSPRADLDQRSSYGTKLYEQAASRFQQWPGGMPNTNSITLERALNLTHGTYGTTIPGLISIECPECDRYACLVFQGDFNRPSPEWMQKRLRIAGIRPLGLLVDLTNYVMLEVGQPLHAFDLEKLHGNKIVVRHARAGEELTTLNGEEHKLKAGQMMICDADRPVGAPGIMGGLETEVTPDTKTILLESAHFESTAVRRIRKELGLSTEASYRFERSVDANGAVAALCRFALLLAECGKQDFAALVDVYPSPMQRLPIDVRIERVNQLLGMEVTAADAQNYLAGLGFELVGNAEPESARRAPRHNTQDTGHDFTVIPPSWRPDVIEEYDIVEEIGRVHGFDKIPETPIRGTTTQGGVFGFDRFVEQVRYKAINLGFVQNVSSSLIAEHPLDDPRGERIGPRNPNSPEMAFLRNSLWPNLADNARRNGGADLRFFEIGATFGAPEPNGEVRKLALFASAGPQAESWLKPPPDPPDFFSLKAAVEEILKLTSLSLTWEHSHDPRLHPARQASLVQGVLVGQVHPDTAEESGIPIDSFLAEIDLESIYAHRGQDLKMRPISRNPAVRRDIAILIDKAVPYSQIKVAIREGAGEMLEKEWLFDVYEGKGIPEGKHSLAIALQIRKMGENLTDEEANQVRDLALAELAKLGAIQR